ncbi:MAG: tRNA uridine-5-carboxymethylaminomethyl(34) synthesis enzyme MnmG, partial [Pseudomonadota bacterium]
VDAVRDRLTAETYTPKQVAAAGVAVNQDGSRRTGMEVLAFPNVQFADIQALVSGLDDVAPEIQAQTERDALYANYIARQEKDVAAMKRDEQHVIPPTFDFDGLDGLSVELKGKLSRARPANIGQAAKIDGMTPAAVALILARLRRDLRARRA